MMSLLLISPGILCACDVRGCALCKSLPSAHTVQLIGKFGHSEVGVSPGMVLWSAICTRCCKGARLKIKCQACVEACLTNTDGVDRGTSSVHDVGIERASVNKWTYGGDRSVSHTMRGSLCVGVCVMRAVVGAWWLVHCRGRRIEEMSG